MGFELETLGNKEFLRITDGDTPFVSMPIRMLSIDTPEVHYPGNQAPSKHDEKLAQLADWIREGVAPVRSDLGRYLYPRLKTGEAGTLQGRQGASAAARLNELIEEKLTRPSGKRRSVYLRSANEPFDSYGRLLAYMAPNYSKKERSSMTRREMATFNLLMVESGWAASFLIYPNLPRHLDLVLLQESAMAAYDEKRGAWAEPLMLTGYEFRMCVRLYDITKKLASKEKLGTGEKEVWIERFCVDMTTQKIFYPQDYYRVLPYNRIFVWPKDVADAVERMNLLTSE